MISVSVFINGNPIFTRSAVNASKAGTEGENVYKVDDGSVIKHDPEDGAVALAKRMLDTIKEV